MTRSLMLNFETLRIVSLSRPRFQHESLLSRHHFASSASLKSILTDDVAQFLPTFIDRCRAISAQRSFRFASKLPHPKPAIPISVPISDKNCLGLPLIRVRLLLDPGERLPLHLGDHVLNDPTGDVAAAEHRRRRGATVVVLQQNLVFGKSSIHRLRDPSSGKGSESRNLGIEPLQNTEYLTTLGAAMNDIRIMFRIFDT